MKKLMFAALAVASCSAFAAKDVQVNDLTLAKKSLSFATKSYSIKITGTDWTNAEQNVTAKFAEITNNIVKACSAYDLDYEMPEITDAWAAIDKSGKVKGSIKFTAPAYKLDRDGKAVASTKVVTTKFNGFVITRGKETKTYLWSDSTKNEEYKKEYKYWGYEIPGAQFGKDVATADGKAQLAMTIVNDAHNLQAVATGTCDKKTGALKSVAGNFADVACMGYGTWKLAANNSVTKKAVDEASGVNKDEDILALKKVELVK